MLSRLGIAIILCLCGWTAYSDDSQKAEYYGSIGCSDWEGVKARYNSPSADSFTGISYADCLYVKGKLTNNSQWVNQAIYIFDNLASPPYDNILANNFLGRYLATDGDLDTYGAGKKYLDESIEYYAKVLALINIRPGYASFMDDYEVYEARGQIELQSYMLIPYLYLAKYNAGAKASSIQKMLASATYEGPRDFEIYPQYADHTLDSLKKAIEHAQDCLRLSQKEYFKKKAYQLVQEICRRNKQRAEKIYVLESRRLDEIVQDYCDDVEIEEICPILSIEREIVGILDEMYNDARFQEAFGAMWN